MPLANRQIGMSRNCMIGEPAKGACQPWFRLVLLEAVMSYPTDEQIQDMYDQDDRRKEMMSDVREEVDEMRERDERYHKDGKGRWVFEG